MKVHFDKSGWDDYLHWARADPGTYQRLNELIEDARRHPSSGLGKPEALKGWLSGWWSRRITGEHRLVYRAQGKGEEQRIEVIQCRHHH